ncbi:MAG: T9SS type A sorting domain-containing protein [Bacteroidales bacterium]|nr:T9SS type A sorting domain-containing protein [Bacteroidales bacterium]
MKKILLFAVCCAGMLSVSAQGLFQKHTHLREDAKCLNLRPAEKMAKSADYNYRLASYNTDDLYITCEYHYDAYRRLVAVHELVPAEYELIDSIRYNEQNQLVRLDGYQKMGASWTNVYFIEYTYNAQGLIASRSNYNNFGGIFELGGTYDYTYNEAGQIIHTELTMGDMVYQTVDYEYENGLLATETWSYSNPFSQSGEFEPAERMSYTYNNSGNLTLITYETYDGISDWGLYGTRTYTYNEVGNCTEMHAYDADENETERSIFTYDNRLLEETLMPWTPEMTRPETFNNKNIYTLEEYWALDVDFVLQYVCDYEYNYVSIDEGVGLADVEQLPLTITPNPTENIIVLSGLAEGTHQMEIVDMAGRIVMSDNVSNSKQIDLSELQKGCYLVKVMNNQNLYTSKVIVK